MFRPIGLLFVPPLLALALATPAPGSALYHLTDLSAREAATLNNRGDVAYRFDARHPYDWGVYNSLNANGVDTWLTDGPSYTTSELRIGEDGALYGSRRESSISGTPQAVRLGVGGGVATIGPSGSLRSMALGANASGVAVGIHEVPGGGLQRVFVHRPATATAPARTDDLGTLGGDTAYPFTPNAAGQFLVDVTDLNIPVFRTQTHLVQPDGSVTRITPPDGYRFARLTAIDDGGEGIGIAVPNGSTFGEPMRWKDGVWTPLTAPNRPGLRVYDATDMNNHGDILLDTNLGAVLVRDGQWYTLDELFDDPEGRWDLLRATAINDLGQILAEGVVAFGEGRDRYRSTVLLTPKSLPAPVAPRVVPEPAALAGFLALAALLARRNRRLVA
jgi:hypothetical protein